MRNQFPRFVAIASLFTAATLGWATAAQAATPTPTWTASGMSQGIFAADGSLVVLAGSSAAGGRIEVRTAATGALLQSMTNPTSYSSLALTRDLQTIAGAVSTSTSKGLARDILLYRVSDGALLR